MDSNCPVFVVLRALVSAGWRYGQPPDVHTAQSPKLFGSDKFVERKCYLQCLLAWDSLVRRGLQELVSKGPAAYYKCVLDAAKPAEVVVGLSAKEYEDACSFQTRPIEHRFKAEDAPDDSDDDGCAWHQLVLGQRLHPGQQPWTAMRCRMRDSGTRMRSRTCR